MARDDFEILDEKPIGSGQFGTVFRARRRRDQRPTALKLILLRGSNGTDTIEAERRGATLQQTFATRHGMVPEVFEFGPDDEDFFIAMELVEGPSLEERLRGGALPYDEGVAHARWLCDFLHAAHNFSPIVEGRQYRLLHNDLKPAHLKLPARPGGERKVLDFGIAKALEESRELATDVGRTIAYAAPERLLSERVNVHADFWSLGVMLYEMAAGHRPYPDLEGPRFRRQLYSAVTTNSPRAALPRDCPPHLYAIINRLLAFQPEHRYQSAAEIRADLDRFARGDVPRAAAYYETPATMPVSRSSSSIGDGSVTSATVVEGATVVAEAAAATFVPVALLPAFAASLAGTPRITASPALVTPPPLATKRVCRWQAA
jgi:eukaryotic-like serine/threonine-protein kinase